MKKVKFAWNRPKMTGKHLRDYEQAKAKALLRKRQP